MGKGGKGLRAQKARSAPSHIQAMWHINGMRLFYITARSSHSSGPASQSSGICGRFMGVPKLCLCAGLPDAASIPIQMCFDAALRQSPWLLQVALVCRAMPLQESAPEPKHSWSCYFIFTSTNWLKQRTYRYRRSGCFCRSVSLVCETTPTTGKLCELSRQQNAREQLVHCVVRGRVHTTLRAFQRASCHVSHVIPKEGWG